MPRKPPYMSTGAFSIRARKGAWWRIRQQIFSEWVATYAPQDIQGPMLKTDLFDEASGPYHYWDAPGAGLKLIGIDLSFEVARAASLRLSQEGRRPAIVVCDVRALPFAGGSFSAALSLSTLDHFDRPDDIHRSLRSLHRVLAVSGRLLLVMDNPANPEVWMRMRLPPALVRRLRADDFRLGVTLGAQEGQAALLATGFLAGPARYLVHPLRYLSIRALDLAERFLPLRLAVWIEGAVAATEALRWLPTRSLTGHYVAWNARKRG